MSKKRFKHKKLPFCVKVLDNDLGEQFKKIAEEFGELGEENSNLLNKINRKEYISAVDIEKAFLEAFDISQAAQGYMHLLLIIFGKHYCLDFNSLFNKAIKKNSDRGYYEYEPFDVADWGDDK